jgi:hypothetical protein
MDLATTDLVDGPLVDALWDLYNGAFAHLRTRAAQRHVLTRDEFDDVMNDRRVTKHLLTDPEAGDRPAGIGTLTNDLAAVPLISPEYYQERWPHAYAEQRIWYVGFLAVGPDYQGSKGLPLLIASMSAVVPPTGGVIAADICQFNEDEFRLPEMFGRVAGRFVPEPNRVRLDIQTYWAYEFATPA